MRENKHFEEFGKPFEASDICWRLQYVDKAKSEGYAVPYLDARAIADRLDAVVGQNCWKDSYTPWHSCTVEGKQKQSQLCTIYIYNEELKEWIGKTDGAEDSDIEPVKGGLSDSFKRAAVKWNIGRYLYGFEPIWVKAKQRGNSYVIEKSEETKLRNEYNRIISVMFGDGKSQPKQVKQNNPQPEQKQTDNVVTMQQPKQNAPIYEIEGVRVNQSENGATSSIILSDKGGRYNAYLYGVDKRLVKGAKITNIQKELRQNSYGQFAVLKSYDMAA